MKKSLLLINLFLLSLFSTTVKADVIITAIVDGDLTGGLPKAIELYIHGTEDLSTYSLSRSSNGGTFSSGSALSGTYTDEFVYLTNNSTEFANTFGNAGDLANVIVNGLVTGNGNDAFAILQGAVTIDQVWEANSSNYYQDSYTYRNSGTGPDAGWIAANWTPAGNGALDGLTAAETAAAVPFGTYEPTLLSVELDGPSAIIEKNSIQVSWATLSETNSASFEVEKSLDGVTFRQESTIEAAGNSLSKINYSWTDDLPRFGLNYYRLKIKNIDGNFDYSSIVVVKFETRLPTFVITPNVSAQSITLKLSKESDLSSDVEIFDMAGHSLMVKRIPVYQFTETIDVSTLSAGLYVVQVRIGSDIYAERFMKF